MDHQYIAEHNLVERYLNRRLPADERTRFEDHFVACPECLDELELARDFQASLRAGVASQAARRTVEAGLLAWLARPAGRAFLAAALAAVVAVPALWLVSGRGGPAARLAPQVNVPTYDLGAVRGGEETPVLTSPASRWLALVLDAGEGFSRYRLTLRDGAGNVVWEESGIEPDRRGKVTLTLPPGALAAGDYRLELAGLDAAGAAAEIDSHALRLTE